MSTQDTLRLADVDPLVLTVPAGAKGIAATAIDLVLPLAGLVGGILAIVLGNPGTGALLLVLAAVAAALIVIAIARTGQALGGRALATRTVKRATGAAAGASLIPALLSRDLVTADLSHGRDPFSAALAPFVFPEVLEQPPLPRRGIRSGAPQVQLDSGERLALDAALVLGRVPTAPADEPAEVYQWPDLSRTLSKSHARLEWDGARLWVIDLNSTNGTFVRSGGASHPLIPYQRTPLPLPADLELGDRTLRVEEAA